MEFLVMKRFTSNWIYVFSVFISIVVSASCQRIHEIMTREELVQTFGRHENLPEYEVVPIYYSHLNKRSVDGRVLISLKSFGKNLKLWLEPTDGMLFTDTTPVYGVSGHSDTENVTFHRYVNAFKVLGPYIYRHYRTYTTLAVDRSSNHQKRMTGVIGSENLVISPLQERLINDVKRHRRSIDNIPESQQNAHHYHIVFKSSLNIFNNIFKPLQNSLRKKRAIKETIYPEILIIVDYNLYKLFDKQWYKMLLYLMGFWNGVDLMFRSIQNPNIRFNIAAIIIAKDHYALSYIASNRAGNGKIRYEWALSESQSWLYENVPAIIKTEDYDVAVTMTSLKLCHSYGNKETCDGLVLGVAYVSGVCDVNDYNRRVLKTALVTENGAFRGIFTAAHELGHSFGAAHDGEGEGVSCSRFGGNLMSPSEQFRYEASEWSPCTLKQWWKRLRTNGKCLFNKPKNGHKLVRILPGKIKNANQQCRLHYASNTSVINATICKRLWCHDPNRLGSLISAGAAVDGTPCGDKKICLHGQCISEYKIRYT